MSEVPPITPIGADRIRELIPHAGKMCLLELVVDYDAESIRCETRTHLAADNPLRHQGRLSCISGIEYAAQAMAVHGALKSGALRSGALKSESSGPRPLTPPAGLTSPLPTTAPDAIRAPARAQHGFLASVRDARCTCRYLDEVTAPLTVSAVLEFDDASRVIYSFTVAAGGSTLISGRAAVVLG